MSLHDELLNMHHIVGYHLPISPTNYQVDIRSDGDDTIVMTSHYDTSPKDACCIPFCCLYPSCIRRKVVDDHFYVNETDSSLTLKSTDAFYGLINCCEKGKIFQVIRDIEPYLIMVNPKEIFVLSLYDATPSLEDQNRIRDDVNKIMELPKDFSIEYL